MTKSKQSLSKTANLRDFSNAISPLGAVLTFAFCLLFFMFVLQPTTYNTKFTFELTQQLSMGSFQTYQFSCSGYEIGNESLLTVLAGIIIGICQFEFLHRKAYLTTLLSFGVKRERLFRHRLLIPFITSVAVIIITELIALGINIEVIGFKPELPLIFLDNLFCILKFFLFSYTATVIACIFTGRVVEAVLSALSLTAFGYILTWFMEIALGFTLYGNPNDDLIMEGRLPMVLNPIADLLNELSEIGTLSPNETYTATLVSSVIWCAICSVVLVILTRYFKNDYKNEKSGFKGIYKSLVAFVTGTFSLCTAFVITYIADSHYDNYYDKKAIIGVLAIIIIASFLIAAALYLLIYRNSKKLKTAFLGSGISASFVLIVFTVCLTGVFGTYNKAPELSEIESVTISSPFPSFSAETYNGRYPNPFRYGHGSQYSFTFTDEKGIKTLREVHELFSDKAEEQFQSGFKIKYTLQNGKTIEREFDYISKDALIESLPLWETEDIQNTYKAMLFPDLEMDNDIPYDDWVFYNDLRPVTDYSSEYMQLSFLSKYGVKTNILDTKKDIFSERQYIELKNAILKDCNEMSYKEHFTPSTQYYGTLLFSRSSSSYENMYEVPVTESMKNTVAFLESLPFYEELTSKSEIQRMAIADIDEFMDFYNGDYFLYEYHEPCLSDDHDLSAYTLSNSNAPVTMVTNKNEMEKTLEKAHTFYLLGNSGKLVFVEFENGTYMTYGLPE